MVILDEKVPMLLPPPPPYVEAGPVSPPPFPTQSRAPPTLVTLPPHILLRIVYETFTQGEVERQRKVLYWLTMNLRVVNRALYIGEPGSLIPENADVSSSRRVRAVLQKHGEIIRLITLCAYPVQVPSCTPSIEEANTETCPPTRPRLVPSSDQPSLDREPY